jgi:hypothetical protein
MHIFTNTLTFVSYEFLLYMNSYIKSKASKEAAASISDDLEGNMKAVLGEETSDVVDPLMLLWQWLSLPQRWLMLYLLWWQ